MGVKAAIFFIILLFSGASHAAFHVIELRKSGVAWGGIFQTESPKIPDSLYMRTGSYSERDRYNQFQVNWMEEYLMLVNWDRRKKNQLGRGEELLSEPDKVIKMSYHLWNPDVGGSYREGNLKDLYPPKEWGEKVISQIKKRDINHHGLELTIELRTEKRLREIKIRGYQVLEVLGISCEQLLE